MPQKSVDIDGGQILSAFAASLHLFLARFEREIVLEKGCPPRDPASPAVSAASGQFFLEREPCDPTPEACHRAVADLLKLLKESMPHLGPEIDRLSQVFVLGHTDEVRFLRMCLSNEGNALMQFCRHHELHEDLFMLFAVLTARPFRSAAARLVAGGMDPQVWDRGSCPVCGHWPALAHIDDQQGLRTLWCLHCGMLWPYSRLRCIFCSQGVQDQLEILHPEGEPNLRVHACRCCRRYIKEVRSPQPAGAFPFDAVYLGTGALDQMAIDEGYFQESMLAVRAVPRDETRAEPAADVRIVN